jgi:hypothetical protein
MLRGVNSRAGAVLGVAWRVALVVALGWVFPDVVLAIAVAAFLVLPVVVVQLPVRPRWAAATIGAFAVACGLQWVSNRVADAQLTALRDELVAYRERHGDYPIGRESDLAREGIRIRMGLPGTRRVVFYAYERRVAQQALAPIVFYTYGQPFGRRGIHVDSGHLFTFD